MRVASFRHLLSRSEPLWFGQLSKYTSLRGVAQATTWQSPKWLCSLVFDVTPCTSHLRRQVPSQFDNAYSLNHIRIFPNDLHRKWLCSLVFNTTPEKITLCEWVRFLVFKITYIFDFPLSGPNKFEPATR